MQLSDDQKRLRADTHAIHRGGNYELRELGNTIWEVEEGKRPDNEDLRAFELNTPMTVLITNDNMFVACRDDVPTADILKEIRAKFRITGPATLYTQPRFDEPFLSSQAVWIEIDEGGSTETFKITQPIRPAGDNERWARVSECVIEGARGGNYLSDNVLVVSCA